MALIAAATVSADEPRCGGAARECEQKIRQMLSGRRYLGATIEDRNPGLVIKSIEPDSPAERAGLQNGDRLIAVNGKPLTRATAREFKQILAGARETGGLFIIIMRGRRYAKVDAKLEPYTKDVIAKIISAHMQQSHPATANGRN